MLYAFTENFVLPLSHDEVVHGKGSLLGKMPGDDWQKFANLRAAARLHVAAAGQEAALHGRRDRAVAEWSHDRSLDWHLLERDPAPRLQRWVRDLNTAYRARARAARARLRRRAASSGSTATTPTRARSPSCAAAPRRTTRARRVQLHAGAAPRFRLGVPLGGFWREILNSDATLYGGSGLGNLGGVAARRASRATAQPLALDHLPPLAVVVLKGEG